MILVVNDHCFEVNAGWSLIFQGPSASHDYKIKMDAMNDESTDNMFQQSIR